MTNRSGENFVTEQLTALIVEDNPDLANIFAKAVQAGGFATEVADAGDLAMACLLSNPPHLVILDLNLPKISGQELLHRIRADESLQNVQVVVATAHAHIAAGLQDEADWILYKPVSFSQLRDLALRLSSSCG